MTRRSLPILIAALWVLAARSPAAADVINYGVDILPNGFLGAHQQQNVGAFYAGSDSGAQQNGALIAGTAAPYRYTIAYSDLAQLVTVATSHIVSAEIFFDMENVESGEGQATIGGVDYVLADNTPSSGSCTPNATSCIPDADRLPSRYANAASGDNDNSFFDIRAQLVAALDGHSGLVIDVKDLQGLSSNFRYDGFNIQIVTNPEPSSLLLLGSGVFGLARWRKRRSRTR